MTIATINEYRCDMGCGATHQSEERWQPEGWLHIQFGVWGQKKTDHHVCPACAVKFQALMGNQEGEDI